MQLKQERRPNGRRFDMRDKRRTACGRRVERIRLNDGCIKMNGRRARAARFARYRTRIMA